MAGHSLFNSLIAHYQLKTGFIMETSKGRCSDHVPLSAFVSDICATLIQYLCAHTFHGL